MIKGTGRYQGVLDFELFKKIIGDLRLFPDSIKVLRMYKDGEPLLNKNLAKMISYAKESGRVPYIDTTTNASLLTPERVGPLVEAGLDKINIPIYGMNSDTYKRFSKFGCDLPNLIGNIRWLRERSS